MTKAQRARVELRKRAHEQKRKSEKPKFIIEDFCFDKQIEFIRDTAKYKTAVCSRRSGKTVSCAADLINTVLSHDEGDVIYITLNRKSAKRIIWRQLLEINKHFDLGGKPDNVELTITFPHGKHPVIHVSGAKDASEIEKFRGMAFRKAYIDESQSFRSYIRELIDDVIEPALTDYDGSLSLIGTPGPIPAGYFYDAAHSPGWSHHSWTIHQNPFIELKAGKSVEELLDQIKKRRGIDETDPTFRREYLSEWVRDTDALVYKFNKRKNLYQDLPEGKMEYIFGIDIGWHDADAIAVLGYSYEDKSVYLVEEWVKNKQTISDLVAKINILKDKYAPVKMVMDSGGLGKKIQEEIQRRHEIPVEAAEKQRKFEFIELLNDDLRTSKFKALSRSRFEQDSYLTQWDRSNPDKLKISNSYHTDIGDAVLYAWRECYHYLYTEPDPVLDPFTDEYMLDMENKEADRMQYETNRKWYEPSLEEMDERQEELEALFEEDEY